jgi:hypothetical protein
MSKRIFIVVVLCLSAIQGLAQQNFFNVPSSDITEKDKLFFQQQINLYAKNTVSNSTLCLGLGNEFEIGLNLFGITYDHHKKSLVASPAHENPVYPAFGLNIQKQLWKYKRYSLALGGQWLVPPELKNFEWYFYLNNKIELNKGKLIGGLYSGNESYFGSPTRFSNSFQNIGFQLGAEYPLPGDRFLFQADFISGKTVLSSLIVGLAYKLTKNWVLSSGYQMPNEKKHPNGIVVELTLVP